MQWTYEVWAATLDVMDAHRYCPQCGWPDAQPYQVVSRHPTTEGVIVYSRCACGRLQVRRADRVAIRQTAPARSTTDPAGPGTPGGVVMGAADSPTSTGPVRSATSVAACLVGLVPVLVGVVALTAPALLALAALSLFVGAVAWVGTWLVLDNTISATRIALTAAGSAAAAGLALGGLLVTFDATSVVVIPLLTVLGGLAWWVLSGPDDEDPGAADVRALPTRGHDVERRRCRR